MNKGTEDILNRLVQDYKELEVCRDSIYRAAECMIDTYNNKGKLLVCGNGGSAADSEHIVGELMKGFIKKRELPDDEKNRLKKRLGPERGGKIGESLEGALPALSLVSQTSISTAYSNDVAPEMVFAQQVYGYGAEGDTLLGISTSGNSENVVLAAEVASFLNLRTVCLTGKNGGRLSDICDVSIVVPSDTTHRIQEYHLPVYHALCAMAEEEFFA